MHTFTRPGSRVRIHVNSDWSGNAEVSFDGSCRSFCVPAHDLLMGKLSLSVRIGPSTWGEVVSIAVEMYMHGKAASMVDDLFLSGHV